MKISNTTHVQNWRKIENCKQLSKLLQIQENNIAIASLHPKYNVFEIPKANGSKRLIEEPQEPLKQILKAINFYLQLVYSQQKPMCAHGFIVPFHRNEVVKNIFTNASAHIKHGYMWQIDFTDFFYQIKLDDVLQILSNHCAHFNDKLMMQIGKLCTRFDRLPMGAPTSPCLSNLYVLPLDIELQALCTAVSITYTRYADDLTFSAENAIDANMQKLIIQIIKNHRLSIQPNKTKYCLPNDVKIVTGLAVTNNGIALQANYLPALHAEIERLKIVKEIENRYKTGMSQKKIKLFEQEIEGKINFANAVLQETSPEAKQLELAWIDAMKPIDTFESMNWLDIPYNFF
jgi:RNA-directed DNA polymerase